MRTKDQYTIAFKENDPDGHETQFNQAYIEWWQNQRRDGGFRLTQQGCIHCIDKLELEYFEIKFDKKTYFTLTMYNNDFKKFINAHKIS